MELGYRNQKYLKLPSLGETSSATSSSVSCESDK